MKKTTVEQVKRAQDIIDTKKVPLADASAYKSELVDETEVKKKKNIAKKTIILYVLKILQQYSSKDHPVPQSAIAKYLNDIDVPCDRKTVGRNIEYLREFGIKVLKVDGKGFYIGKSTIAKNSKQEECYDRGKEK